MNPKEFLFTLRKIIYDKTIHHHTIFNYKLNLILYEISIKDKRLRVLIINY